MNPLTCAKCETEIPNSAVHFQGRPFHLACSPMFEMLVEPQLDFNSLKLTSVGGGGGSAGVGARRADPGHARVGAGYSRRAPQARISHHLRGGLIPGRLPPRRVKPFHWMALGVALLAAPPGFCGGGLRELQVGRHPRACAVSRRGRAGHGRYAGGRCARSRARSRLRARAVAGGRRHVCGPAEPEEARTECIRGHGALPRPARRPLSSLTRRPSLGGRLDAADGALPRGLQRRRRMQHTPEDRRLRFPRRRTRHTGAERRERPNRPCDADGAAAGGVASAQLVLGEDDLRRLDHRRHGRAL